MKNHSSVRKCRVAIQLQTSYFGVCDLFDSKHRNSWVSKPTVAAAVTLKKSNDTQTYDSHSSLPFKQCTHLIITKRGHTSGHHRVTGAQGETTEDLYFQKQMLLLYFHSTWVKFSTQGKPCISAYTHSPWFFPIGMKAADSLMFHYLWNVYCGAAAHHRRAFTFQSHPHPCNHVSSYIITFQLLTGGWPLPPNMPNLIHVFPYREMPCLYRRWTEKTSPHQHAASCQSYKKRCRSFLWFSSGHVQLFLVGCICSAWKWCKQFAGFGSEKRGKEKRDREKRG